MYQLKNSQYTRFLEISPLEKRRLSAQQQLTSDELERLGLAIVVRHTCGYAILIVRCIEKGGASQWVVVDVVESLMSGVWSSASQSR